MALVVSSPRISSFQGDRKPWMLKDFLLDDLGSCSSSGFRSFPRRQCCVAVRNLIEIEVRNRNSSGSTSRRLSKSFSSSSKISNAIQRASLAVISAVKLLPFKSVSAKGSSSNASKSGKKKKLLPRSFSKKLFRKSLWKKASSQADDRTTSCEIERWISSGAASVEKYQPSDLSNATTSTTITVTSVSTTSSTNSDAWSESESEFTQPRQSLDENGVVEGKRSSSAKSKRRISIGNESIEAATTKKIWSNEGEKEQSSPVSVLSFPEENEEVESSSPFTRRLNHLEGTKEKLTQKLSRFECLSRIGKINLEARLPLATESEDGSPKLSFQSSPSPLHATNVSSIKGEESEEEVAERLLNLLKSKTPLSNGHLLNTDSLLIGFFQEGLAKASGKNYKSVEDMLLIEAEDWLCGRSYNEASLGWKMKEKRKVYVKDVEEAGEWKSNRDTEKEEVAIQVETEVLSSLVDEMVGEFSNLELLKLLCY